MMIFFQVCFFVGILLTVATLLLGGIFDILDLDGIDFDLDFAGIDIAIPLSPSVILIMITVFGGSGIILTLKATFLYEWLIVLLALLIASIIGVGVYKLVIQPLKKAQNTSSPEEDEVIGLPAIVSETIEEGGFGEITYVIHGNTFKAPSKSVNGKSIKKNTQVAICWIKEYVFYVTSFDDISK